MEEIWAVWLLEKEKKVYPENAPVKNHCCREVAVTFLAYESHCWKKKDFCFIAFFSSEIYDKSWIGHNFNIVKLGHFVLKFYNI